MRPNWHEGCGKTLVLSLLRHFPHTISLEWEELLTITTAYYVPLCWKKYEVTKKVLGALPRRSAPSWLQHRETCSTHNWKVQLRELNYPHTGLVLCHREHCQFWSWKFHWIRRQILEDEEVKSTVEEWLEYEWKTFLLTGKPHSEGVDTLKMASIYEWMSLLFTRKLNHTLFKS